MAIGCLWFFGLTHKIRADVSSWQSRSDFKAGMFDNVEADSTINSLKLKPAGEWEFRAWKTPDQSLTVGTVMDNDDDGFYLLAGASRWFAKYYPKNNEWKQLAPPPHTTYYGAGGVYLDGYFYVMFGDYQNTFARYNAVTNSWEELNNTPDLVYRGGSLVTDGTNLYATRGYATTDVWKYDVSSGSWSVLTSAPATLYYGSSMVYHNGYLYLTRGYGRTNFYRYEISSGTWTSMANLPAGASEETRLDVRGNYIYFLRNANTQSFYRYNIDTNSWQTLSQTPQRTRYVGLIYNSSDDRIYVFRGANQYDMWKYDADNDSFVGPADLGSNPGSGADLLFYNDYIYQLRGRGTTSFYRYNPTNKVWETRASAPASFNDDTKGVVVGSYMYFLRGSGTTTFYRYDPGSNSWSSLADTPAGVRYGGVLVYPGSGNYIYATRGSYTRSFWRYDITTDTWDDGGVSDLPNNAEASYGARMVSDGNKIYYLSGSRTGSILEYDIGTDAWTEIGMLPYAPNWGTDAVYYNGSIYVQSGGYEKNFWKFDVATHQWSWLNPLQQYFGYDQGPYNGGSLVMDEVNHVFYSIMGADRLYMAKFQPNIDYNYVASGEWVSEARDLHFVSTWDSLVADADLPSGTSAIFQTRTSNDKVSWDGWETVTNGIIASAPKRYIQVKVQLQADTNRMTTPTIRNITINYQGDVTNPSKPTSITAKASDVSQTILVSGTTYNYDHPYFQWSGASDSDSGVAGYYVYFGTDANADPVASGSWQTATSYAVTKELSNGTYHLRIKVKDGSGNLSSVWEAFTYVYQGVTASEINKNTANDFNQGTLTNMQIVGNGIKLAGEAGKWVEEWIGYTPANLYYGSATAYVASTNRIYVLRGSNTNAFYSYDLTNQTWETLSNAPAGVSYGGALVAGPGGYLYAFRGNNTNSFWRYDIANDTWDDGVAADAPQTIYAGSDLVYDGSRYIYALRGNNDDTFLRYDTQNNEWTSLASVDFGAIANQPHNRVYRGGDLAIDNQGRIYAIQGGTLTGFAVYDPETDMWTTLPKTPAAVEIGGKLEYDEQTNALYLISGWGKNYFFKYDLDTGKWESLEEGPSTFSYGTGMVDVAGKLYITRAYNSRYVYVYDPKKEKWLVPTRGLFGKMYQGSDIRSTSYGADIVKGEGDYFYITRGGYFGDFIKYNPKTGEVVKLADTPTGLYVGAAMAYDGVHQKIYLIASQQNNNFYVYDIATNEWSKEDADNLPADPSSGASLAFDGNRYIYYLRGGGSRNFYRFDIQGNAGNKWESLSLIPGGVNYGSQLVFKNNYLYAMRGGNVLPNPLYRYDPASNSWTTLSSLDDRIYNDGFLVDGNNGYLYACRGSNTTSCYRYSLANDSWETIAEAPGRIYYGGAAASDGAGKMYVLFGRGSGSFSDGLYTYIMQSDNTSFKQEGNYVSEAIDMGEVYRYADVKVDYTPAENVHLEVYTRSSDDGNDWSEWTQAGQEKVKDHSYEYKINSAIKRYLQIKLAMKSDDGLYSGTINGFSMAYYSDTVAPTNANQLSVHPSASASAELSSNTWYNYPHPYFDWPDAEVSGGASDTTTGSSVAGYYVYFGTDADANPAVEGTFIEESSFTASNLVSGETYYLRIRTKDEAGNISSQTWQPFVYKFDNEPPTVPTNLAADPSGYSAVNDFDFSWDEATDSGSGQLVYCYKTATSSGTLASDQCTNSNQITGITAYQTGANTFYVRTKDGAGNYSDYATVSFYFNNGAPSAPSNLQVTPEENTENNFGFSWDPPVAYYGSLENIKYYYSINALPTSASAVRVDGTSLPASSYATLPGKNTLYLVAMDEAGNIDYNSYASVDFWANTTAPGVPTNVDIADVSVKATSSWKLALSWESPASTGAGVAKYRIYRSIDGENFSQVADTSGISYVDTHLNQKVYYYKVQACDSANNCGAKSNVVSMYPDGKFTTPAPLIGEPEVSGLTTKRATIKWTTSRTADSKIAYGLKSGDYFDEEVGNSDQVTSHKVVLNNLSPGTKYYFKAKWTDEDGNLGVSDEYVFTTDPAPFAKEVKAINVGIDSANIQFTSSHAVKAKIYYGKTTAFGGYTEMGVGDEESTYTVHLSGLADGSKYYYKISLFDSEGTEYDGDIYSFTTLPKPKIETVKLQQVKGRATATVLLTWTTNTELSSIVTYYPSANPSAAKDLIDVKLRKAHRKLIGGLLANTAYTLVIKGRDKMGNEAESTPQTFTTASDTRPPEIANLKVEPIIEGVGEDAKVRLAVSWDTDELATSQVAYGDGTSGPLNSKTQMDMDLTYNHMVVVSGLQPSKVYHLKVLSQDKAKNEAESVERVVITPKAVKSALNLVISNLAQAFKFLNDWGGR